MNRNGFVLSFRSRTPDMFECLTVVSSKGVNIVFVRTTFKHSADSVVNQKWKTQNLNLETISTPSEIHRMRKHFQLSLIKKAFWVVREWGQLSVSKFIHSVIPSYSMAGQVLWKTLPHRPIALVAFPLRWRSEGKKQVWRTHVRIWGR